MISIIFYKQWIEVAQEVPKIAWRTRKPYYHRWQSLGLQMIMFLREGSCWQLRLRFLYNVTVP